MGVVNVKEITKPESTSQVISRSAGQDFFRTESLYSVGLFVLFAAA